MENVVEKKDVRDDEEDDNDTDLYESMYQQVLNQSIRSVKYFIVITAAVNFLYSSRSAIWIQYARQFDNYSLDIVSYVFALDSILMGLAGMIFATLGDYIGFDKSITLKIFIIFIGCFIECIAYDFFLLCIGFLISQTATVYVCLAYIGWILPTSEGTKQIATMYAIVVSSYMIGPFFSGLLYKLFLSLKIIVLTLIIEVISYFRYSYLDNEL